MRYNTAAIKRLNEIKEVNNIVKLRTISIFTLLSISLLLVACAPSTGTSTEISCDDFRQQPHMSKQINVPAGDTFTVTLCSNATTGFEWSESAQISDPTIVQKTDHEFVAPDTGLVGAPGKEVWTFKALKKGTSTIVFEYSRPWEGGEKGEWTFNLTVTVK
ncbi:MAG: protease inhibitor I42 family protein [Chloroflexota bacterium]|nr:MAG: protease inhibitor I42 family protein [Chloroflexota bacterium]